MNSPKLYFKGLACIPIIGGPLDGAVAQDVGAELLVPYQSLFNPVAYKVPGGYDPGPRRVHVYQRYAAKGLVTWKVTYQYEGVRES